MVLALITVATIACAILAGDNNIPRSRAESVAAVEAEAFLNSVQPHVSLVTLLAVAYVESRFAPSGSARDRANHIWGVMQISARPQARERLLDPTINIAIGARMLETAWSRAHLRTPRDWVGAYYVGSVPRSRRALRAYFRYARRVHQAEGLMRRQLLGCERAP